MGTAPITLEKGMGWMQEIQEAKGGSSDVKRWGKNKTGRPGMVIPYKHSTW